MSSRKAVAEVCSNTPSPALVAVDTTSSPSALPSEPSIARFGPWDSELDNAMMTPGPGDKVTTIETTTNPNQSCSDILVHPRADYMRRRL
ncbi:hypothetical protein EMIT047CA2_120102 [Pseudomonas soli]